MLIWNQFRNKKYYKNYKKYRHICYPNNDHKLKEDIVYRTVKTYGNKKFMCVSFTNQAKQIEFYLWDMFTYEMFMTLVEMRDV